MQPLLDLFRADRSQQDSFHAEVFLKQHNVFGRVLRESIMRLRRGKHTDKDRSRMPYQVAINISNEALKRIRRVASIDPDLYHHERRDRVETPKT